MAKTLLAPPDGLTRCEWPLQHEAQIPYHDQEWGVPVTDDRRQFEFLVLEAAQAGLSWQTILLRRGGYRAAFHDFDPLAVARMTQADVERLMLDSSIIRNRKKIESTIRNAQAFLNIVEEYGSFCRYFWNFVDGRPIQNRCVQTTDIPAKTPLAESIAKDMKRRGFSFLGPVVMYAHMQASGMVNDHLVSCFRHGEV